MDSPEPFAKLAPLADGADSAGIQSAETALGVSFPGDYRAFLQWSNGWEGWLGDAYLQLASTDDLAAANDASFREANPGIIALGGDGGLETFAFDYRHSSEPTGLVALDRVAGLGSVQWIGPSFTAALSRLANNPDGPWGPDQ